MSTVPLAPRWARVSLTALLAALVLAALLARVAG